MAQRESNMEQKSKKGLIVFIRHGKTDWNNLGLMQGREDIPLNEEGVGQSRETAKSLKKSIDSAKITFDKVISSPLMRARTLGEMIAKEIECSEFYCDEGIIERDFGALSGKPYDKNSPAITKDVSDCPSLESVSSLVCRVNEFIKNNASENENIIVVTHGAVTRIFADNAKKAPDFKITAPFLNNCHLVVYKYDGREPILIGYNIPSNSFDKFLEGKI